MNENIPIGVGDLSSAAIGANIVAILATNLANPNAEWDKIGGNSIENDMKVIFILKVIPTLASIKNIGVALGLFFTNMRGTDPQIDNRNPNTIDLLSPILLSIERDNKINIISKIDEIIELI